jgi:hypothetical protein
MFITRNEKTLCFSHLVWGANIPLLALNFVPRFARDKKSALGHFWHRQTAARKTRLFLITRHEGDFFGTVMGKYRRVPNLR